MDIHQHMRKPKTKQHRVGRCFITFHCTPKDMYRKQRKRTKKREARKPLAKQSPSRLPERTDERPTKLAGSSETRDTIAN